MNISWKGLAGLAIIGGVAAIVVATQLGGSGSNELTQLPPAEPPPAGAATTPADNATAPAGEEAALEEESSSPADAEDGVAEKIAALEVKVVDDRTDLDSVAELARLYFQLRMYPRAADFFANALDLDPDSARLRTDLGSALLYQGMLGLAKREYVKAIAIDPSIPDPHFNLAVILSHGNPTDIPGAMEEWREVIRVAPGSDLAIQAKANIDSYETGGSPSSEAALPQALP